MAKESIFNENIDEKEPQLKDTDFIIFATKHQKQEGTPSLLYMLRKLA